MKFYFGRIRIEQLENRRLVLIFIHSGVINAYLGIKPITTDKIEVKLKIQLHFLLFIKKSAAPYYTTLLAIIKYKQNQKLLDFLPINRKFR